MRPLPALALLLAAPAVLLAAPTVAQDLSPAPGGVLSSQGLGGPEIGFTLRGGVAATPAYSGDDDYELGPDFGFQMNYLRLGGFTFGNPDPLFVPEGLGVTGSFRFLPERDADDEPELDGLDDVDTSVELGGGLRYATRDFEVFGVVRYGVIGHESFVGEVGADVFARPNDRWTLRAGPRLLFGDDDYVATYYGVTDDEAAASGGGLDAFDTDGGLVSAGVELGAGYRINDRWGLDAALTYERLQDDAADSPITGDDTQFTARIGVTRRFTLGF
jgi:outer membrane scaffolding protein for murein synthesis (MipA/OmpV family)